MRKEKQRKVVLAFCRKKQVLAPYFARPDNTQDPDSLKVEPNLQIPQRLFFLDLVNPWLETKTSLPKTPCLSIHPYVEKPIFGNALSPPLSKSSKKLHHSPPTPHPVISKAKLPHLLHPTQNYTLPSLKHPQTNLSFTSNPFLNRDPPWSQSPHS